VTTNRARRIGLYVVCALLIAGVVWFAAGWLPLSSAPPISQPLRRAVWLGVEWAMDPHTNAEIVALTNALRSQRITDVYAYVSYLRDDDTFNPTYEEAADFTARFQALAPEIMLWGWVGVPMQVSPTGPVANRLDSAEVRALVSEFAAEVVGSLGFSGVHLNAEMIPNDDAAYLATLREIRAALPADSLLSVAPHALRLTENITSIPYPTQPHHWTPDYLQAVTAEVDQVAMMVYDSGLFLPADYRAWATYQVREVANALANTEAEVFIGLPVSQEQTPSHHVAAENLTQALHALAVGLSEAATPQTVTGIALYPYWEIDDAKWLLLAALP
jgi:hypothetical protein